MEKVRTMIRTIVRKLLAPFVRCLKWLISKEQVVKLVITYVNPSERFTGHKVLVTGGTSGIGLACAKAFLAEGAEVLICARNEDALTKTASEINSPCLKSMKWDIGDVKSIPGKLSEAVKMMGGDIDIFVNAAGVSAYNGRINDEDVYDYIVDINTKGLFFMCKAQGEYLRSRNIHGKIVNITSRGGTSKSFDSYTLSKWGANSLTYGLARMLAPYHINVNGVAPGCVPTNIVKHLQCHMGKENQYYKGHWIGRFVQPEEIAATVKFLASCEADSIIGQIVAVDGGC